jgi:anti-sigma regulatory factor (Ser/Thr protein kinase)
MADDVAPDGQPPGASMRRVEATAMEADAVGRARRLVVEQLRQWRCAETDDVALVLSELVTNAVVHAGGAERITVTRDGAHVRIEVHDNRAARPHLRADTTDPGGVGLRIVDQLSERWGSHPTAAGKLVWAVLTCADGAPGG